MAASQSYRPPTPETSSPTYSDSHEEFPFFMPAGEKSGYRNGKRHNFISLQQINDRLAVFPCVIEVSQQSLQPINEKHASMLFGPGCRQHNHEKPSMPSPCPSSCFSLSIGCHKSSPTMGTFIVDILPQIAVPPTRLPSVTQTDTFREKLHPVKLPPVTLPTVCLPSTPSPILADLSVFPRVVVVNPTPHPTPPATPILRNVTSPALPSEHLLPPLPSPVLMTLLPSTERAGPPPEAQLSPTPAKVSPAPATSDEAHKSSDRRFFLKQSPDGVSPERDGSVDGGKAAFSEVVEARSGGPSQIQRKGSAESDRPATTKSIRKGKEVVRNVVKSNGRRGPLARPTIRRQPSAEGSKHRPTFNIGSSSSNGSKGAQNGDGSSSSKVIPPLLPKPKESLPSPVKTAHSVKTSRTQGRRIVVASSASSEYETDSDDDSWCSEEMSAEENEKTKEDTRLREAALEAQRQRDMFAKVPKRSYSNLDRSKSGLLSTLLNPDPNIFPPSHPYRSTLSSHDITQLPRRTHPGLAPMTPLTTNKSSVATPQASQATAQAPSTNGTNHRQKGKADRGYQPKGRPQGQEMEDDSDSEEENPDDKIQVSRSVAQERLAALAGRRGIERSQSSRPAEPVAARPTLPTVTSAPIPLSHPYNLPAPAPPMTPRTTRRQMLSTELSESLRRNLLWERQLIKAMAPKRQSILGNGLRPLTSTTGGESSRSGGANPKPSTSHDGRDEKADKRRRAMARNRSWADDYHYSGW